jgi:WD40 repeat protein
LCGLPTADWKRRLELQGHPDALSDVRFSGGGGTVYTAGSQGLFLEWDASGEAGLDQQLARPPADAGFVWAGAQVAVAGDTGAVVTVDTYSPQDNAAASPARFYFTVRSCPQKDPGCGRVVHRSQGIGAEVSVSADGRRALVAVSREAGMEASGGGPPVEARFDWLLLDDRGQLLAEQDGSAGQSPAYAARLSPDGMTVVSVDNAAGVLEIWDAGTLVRRRDIPLPVRDPEAVVPELTFVPGADELIITTFTGEAAVLSLKSGRRIATLQDPGRPPIAAVSAAQDGRLVAGGRLDGSTVVWRTDDWREVITPKAPALASQSYAVDISPNGRTLLVAGEDQVLVSDLRTGAPTGQSLEVRARGETRARFLDDDLILTYSSLAPSRTWPIDPRTWVQRACDLANRQLTSAEWRDVVGRGSPQPTCPG